MDLPKGNHAIKGLGLHITNRNLCLKQLTGNYVVMIMGIYFLHNGI